MIEDASEFAKKAHAGQVRKGTKIPYFMHLQEAADIVRTLSADEEVIAAAYLHDILEDTKVTLDVLREQFGNRVAEFVESETEHREVGYDKTATWHQRKQATIEELKTASEEVKIIALGDKLSNMRSTKKEYDRIGDRVWERFNERNKKEHEWYYKGLAEALSSLSGTEAWKEMKKLTEYVFGR